MKNTLLNIKKHLILLIITYTFNVNAQTTFNVGIIQTDYAPVSDMVTAIINQSNEIIQAHPDVDILLTPEYSLFDITATESRYIRLTKQGDVYILNQSDGDSQIINHLNMILNFAATNNVGFVLGTAPLKLDINQTLYPNLNPTAVFNTTLFINKNGEIFDYDLKVRGSDWIITDQNYPAFSFLPATDLPSYTDGYPIFEDSGVYLVANNTHPGSVDAVNFTNKTTKVRSFFKEGIEFRYAALTCAERHSFEMLDQYQDELVDVVFYNEWEGYYWFSDLMEAFQSGEDPTNFVIGNTNISLEVPYAWNAFKKDLHKEFRNRNMIDEHTYLVATDSKNGAAGAFCYNFEAIDANTIDYSQDWVYVEIPEPTSLSITDIEDGNSFRVFPNPVQNQLNIILPFQTTLQKFTITDLSGRLLKQGRITSKQLSVDVSFLSEGVFIISILNANGGFNSVKFIKQN